MSDSRRRFAADNRQRIMDEFMILYCRHHKESKVDSPYYVARKGGITHMLAPSGQPLAFTLFDIAPSHDSPPSVALEYASACLHLIVYVYDS